MSKNIFRHKVDPYHVSTIRKSAEKKFLPDFVEFKKVINMIYAIFKKFYTYTQTYPYFVDKFK